jgi:hypothetical protein
VPQDDVCAFQKQHREPWQLVPWLEGTVAGDSLTGQTGTANNAPKVVSARAK